jgi:hypothetical protein
MDSSKKSTKDHDNILNLDKKLKIDVKQKLHPPQIAWQLKNLKSPGIGILGTLGNFSLVIGKAKSGKSFFINIAVSTAVSEELIFDRFKSELPKEKNEVLYFDTEQGKYHVQLALKRICRQINTDEPTNLHVYHLRSKTPAERLKIIEALIYDNKKVGFVVIDGIKDLVTSINDEAEATMIASKLLKWTEERNIHIVTVLHQNKSDNKARGHIGTELINKAETVLSITKSESDKNIAIVEPQQCRNIEPESFAFEIVDGLPIVLNKYAISKTVKRNSKNVEILDDLKLKELLNSVYSQADSFGYTKLVVQMKLGHKKLFSKEIGDNRTKDLITQCKIKDWLLQEKEKAPYTLGDFKNKP